MKKIHISNKFRKLIRKVIEKENCSNVNEIMFNLEENGYIIKEFSDIIFPNKRRDSEAECVLLDEIEDEIKRQLLDKYNK